MLPSSAWKPGVLEAREIYVFRSVHRSLQCTPVNSGSGGMHVIARIERSLRANLRKAGLNITRIDGIGNPLIPGRGSISRCAAANQEHLLRPRHRNVQ